MVTDPSGRERAAEIGGGIVLVDGRMLSPEEFRLSGYEIVRYTRREERELEHWGMLAAHSDKPFRGE